MQWAFVQAVRIKYVYNNIKSILASYSNWSMMISLILITYYNIGYQEYNLEYIHQLFEIVNGEKNNILDAIE